MCYSGKGITSRRRFKVVKIIKDVPKIIEENELNYLKSVLPYSLSKRRGSYYIKINNLYRSTLILHDFPHEIPDGVLARLFHKLREHTIIIDSDLLSPKAAKKAVSDSLSEIDSRHRQDRTPSQERDDQFEMEQLSGLFSAMQQNESLISSTIRIIVTASMQSELDSKIKEVEELLELEDIKAFIPQNEMLQEYTNLLAPANSVRKPMPLWSTWARQFPFYHHEHVDQDAHYFGYTPSGGNVFLNTWTTGGQRLSFDALLIGVKKAGKSATLKSMAQNEILDGNRGFILDPEGEFVDFGKKLGGVIVDPFDPRYRYNPLELTSYIMLDDNQSTSNAFLLELSRIEDFFYQYVPSLTDVDANELKEFLRITYVKKGITQATKFDELAHTDFPIFSDLLGTIRESLYVGYGDQQRPNPNLSPGKIKSYETLEAYVQSLSEGVLGNLFNHHSTINITTADLVVFDLKNISAMQQKIFNAYFSSISSLVWKEAVKNRILNQNRQDKNEFTRVFLLFDECTRYLNSGNSRAIEMVDRWLHQDRKYDAGIWLATQTPQDMLPSGTGECADKLRNILNLVQYKMIMAQESTSLPILDSLLNDFTGSELESTCFFESGEMLLRISSDTKIHCRKYVPHEDLVLFGGGQERDGDMD